MVARGEGCVTLMLERSETTRATGDHKGRPHPTSSALAPTDGDTLFRRLMPHRRNSLRPYRLAEMKGGLKRVVIEIFVTSGRFVSQRGRL